MILALLLLACAWPTSAPSPSQPLIVEVSIGDTANASNASGSDSPTPEGAPEAEAAPEALGAHTEAGPGESQARTDPGVGGDHAH